MSEIIWQRHSIIRNSDGTFVVHHNTSWGELPYQVCSREIDPDNLYDLAEVAAFWDSLPEGDPRKALPPPPPEDTRTPEEMRQAAYEVEADPLFELAMFYQAEADGFRLLNDLAKAAEASGSPVEYRTLPPELMDEFQESLKNKDDLAEELHI